MKPLQLKFVKLVIVITGLYLIVINRFEFPTFGGHTTRSGIRLKPSDDSNFFPIPISLVKTEQVDTQFHQEKNLKLSALE